ncbi:MAG: right-handed parallel beta-helix repeat-containing protein [Deltaproteobacteria bacterium]|nr:right-handed parallel beta-helix repeat-containing protein [Deltaproteobacteria bacterium]
MRAPLLAMLLAGIVVAPSAARAMQEITTCGAFVRGSATLVADLDCSATDDDAVKLQGRLHLAGFTLTGHPAHAVVRCEKGPCRVEGPGSLRGAAEGVRSDKNTRLIDVIVRDNAGIGVYARKTARLDDASVTGNGGVGVHADKINARGTRFAGNGDDGAHTVRKAQLFECTVSGNLGDGVSSDRLAKVSHYTTVTGNGLDGVDAGRIMVKRAAAVAMNGASPACGVSEACDDLATDRRPIVSFDAVCGTSRDTADGGSWGVCLDD